MRRAWDYTTEELRALTPEAILRLKDQECLQEGCPLLPEHPGPEPVKPEVVGERVAFKVTAEMLFTNEDDAQEVLALIRSKARVDEVYMAGNWRGPMGLKPEDPNQGTMETKRFWSDQQWATHKTDQERYSQAQVRWDAEDKEYKAALKAREKAVARVDELLERAWEEQRIAEAIKATYQRYLELSDGVQVVALRFLLQNNSQWNEDTVNKVLGLAQYAPAQEGTPHGQDD